MLYTTLHRVRSVLVIIVINVLNLCFHKSLNIIKLMFYTVRYVDIQSPEESKCLFTFVFFKCQKLANTYWSSTADGLIMLRSFLLLTVYVEPQNQQKEQFHTGAITAHQVIRSQGAEQNFSSTKTA